MTLDILYQDEYLVAINKPHGLAVHRSRLHVDATEFALQLLRNQIGKRVYPLHRLDRKTSGVLLFALDAETTKLVQQQFVNHTIEKKYWAIVRGWFPESLTLDYALKNDRGVVQEATTIFKCLKQSELNLPSIPRPDGFGKFPTSRYSIIEAKPKTGRTHQIRKHCKHLFHPIIGDRPHGCNKQNRIFKNKWNMMTTMLHSKELNFEHPISRKWTTIEAPLSAEFERMIEVLLLK